MKCSICGKEFGDGINCQNCGVDRVTGLANYSGHEPSIGNYHSQGNYSQSNSSYNEDNTSLKTMVCYACGEIIPINSEYCPHCRKKLYETCPKCGATYSSQFNVCNKCGTDRVQYYLELDAQKKKERKEQEEIKVRDEASELRRKLQGMAVIWWFLLCLVLFSSIPFLFDVLDGKDGTILFSIIIGVCCIAIASLYIIIKLQKERITKWKQEHPNDPRSKYL